MKILMNVKRTEVVEMGWCEASKKMVLSRFRNDKVAPNQIHVAISVWEQIFEPISEKTLRGQNDMLVRNFHRRIKRDLYKSIPDGSTVVDVGSGVGKDAVNWTRYDKILCIEPNEKSIPDLNVNLEKNSILEKAQVVQGKIENTTLVSKRIEHFIGNQVDAMTFMFSMGNLWNTEAGLDRLCGTIQENLKLGGQILFFGFDGYCLEQFFDPVFGGAAPVNGKFEFAGHTLTFNPESGEVEMDGFKENVMYIDELIQTYNNKGYETMLKLSWQRTADQERLMTPGEFKFTRLFSFGKLRLIEIPDEEPKLPSGSIGSSSRKTTKTAKPKTTKSTKNVKDMVSDEEELEELEEPDEPLDIETDSDRETSELEEEVSDLGDAISDLEKEPYSDIEDQEEELELPEK